MRYYLILFIMLTGCGGSPLDDVFVEDPEIPTEPTECAEAAPEIIEVEVEIEVTVLPVNMEVDFECKKKGKTYTCSGEINGEERQFVFDLKKIHRSEYDLIGDIFEE